MGVGKSLISLLWAKRNPEVRPIVIVCPASLKWNWHREVTHHFGMTAEILEGTKPKGDKISSLHKIFIINYDILKPWMKALKGIKPKLIILDEVHFMKEDKSLRTKMGKILCEGVPYILALSGTPMINRPRELWPIIKIIKPKLYRSFRQFADLHCKPRLTPWGWNFDGANRLDLLHNTLIEHMMVRRLKKDVLLDLPPKQRFVVPIEIDNRKEYNKAVNDFSSWLLSKDISKGKRALKALELVKKNELKMLIARLKIKSVIGWIDNFLEGTDEKLLVFAIHKQIVSELRLKYEKRCLVIDGDVPPKQRLSIIDTFQSDKKKRLLIGNIQAAGVGLNATASSTVAFTELGWTPGEMMQCEDRSHRHGQTKNVKIYYLVARNTMEEKLCELLDKKQKTSDQTLDGIEDGIGLDIHNQITDYLLRGSKDDF